MSFADLFLTFVLLQSCPDCPHMWVPDQYDKTVSVEYFLNLPSDYNVV